jgi:hypothetical protein
MPDARIADLNRLRGRTGLSATSLVNACRYNDHGREKAHASDKYRRMCSRKFWGLCAEVRAAMTSDRSLLTETRIAS